jgi:hypothetical protein
VGMVEAGTQKFKSLDVPTQMVLGFTASGMARHTLFSL